MGAILFMIGLVLFGLGVLYVLGCIIYAVVCSGCEIGMGLFNFGYHQLVVRPQLEADGYLERRKADENAQLAAREAAAKAEQLSKIDREAMALADKRQTLMDKYPLADEALVDKYMTAYRTEPLMVCDVIEQELAADQAAKATAMVAEFDTASARTVTDTRVNGVKAAVRRDDVGNAWVHVDVLDDGSSFDMPMSLEAAHYALIMVNDAGKTLTRVTARDLVASAPAVLNRIKSRLVA